MRIVFDRVTAPHYHPIRAAVLGSSGGCDLRYERYVAQSLSLLICQAANHSLTLKAALKAHTKMCVCACVILIYTQLGDITIMA